MISPPAPAPARCPNRTHPVTRAAPPCVHARARMHVPRRGRRQTRKSPSPRSSAGQRTPDRPRAWANRKQWRRLETTLISETSVSAYICCLSGWAATHPGRTGRRRPARSRTLASSSRRRARALTVVGRSATTRAECAKTQQRPEREARHALAAAGASCRARPPEGLLVRAFARPRHDPHQAVDCRSSTLRR
jgi:hypothetical protein